MIYKSYLLENNINIDKKAFLFFGENLGLISDFKNKIRNSSKEKEIINFSQDDLITSTNKLFNEITNISLFEKEKVIFINQATDKALGIVEEIIPRLENQKIFLFANILDKKSKIRNYFEKSNLCGAVACYQDNEITLKKIIIERLVSYEGLSTENINLILNSVGLDRIKLNNELEKVKTLFKNKRINTKELQVLLNINTNDDFNLLKDQALLGNKLKTNKLLGETNFEGEKIVFYLSSINSFKTRNTQNITNKFRKGVSELKPICSEDV